MGLNVRLTWTPGEWRDACERAEALLMDALHDQAALLHRLRAIVDGHDGPAVWEVEDLIQYHWMPGDPVYIGDTLAPQTPAELPEPRPARHPTKPLVAQPKDPAVPSPREEGR